MKRFCSNAILAGCLAVLSSVLGSGVEAQDRLDDPPISYLSTPGDNPITALRDDLNSGEVKLRYEPEFGYLRSILEHLDIPVESQSLVFSKTSLQSRRISPTNPRAIFFNDDVYLGWVRGSSLLELSTADPKLGAAFYTIVMRPDRPSLRRENHSCLVCHETTVEGAKVPEHVVRSVMTRESGKINLLLSEYITHHTSPIEERWGGWYVTGSVGQMHHMGNAFLEGETLRPIREANPSTTQSMFPSDRWLTPYSDVVALMVLEHQTQTHNRMIEADYAVRRARHADDADAIGTAIERGAERVLDYLLLSGEAPLESPIKGTSGFAEQFSKRGPVDKQGRSLRQFDLEKRMFRYPCSYLIYSSAFDALDAGLQERIYQRLRGILESSHGTDDYEHLSDADRMSIREILKATKPEIFKVKIASLVD